MKILITGAAGNVGRVAVREFTDHGHSVRGLDIKPLPSMLSGLAEMTYGDITDKMALFRAAEGCDAVVHLAARTLELKTQDRTIDDNVVGAQRVLGAAEALGIGRVAIASSNCVYGMVAADPPLIPLYLPIDEAHPLRPTDFYSLSKLLVEELAAAYVRRGKMDVVCLRLADVIRPAMPPKWLERRRWRLRNITDPRYTDFWSYIRVEDVARAFRLAVERPLSGFHLMNLAASESFTTRDIREMIRIKVPELASFCATLDAGSPLYDTTRARQELGFTTPTSWRDLPEYAGVEDEPEDPHRFRR